MLHTIYLDLNCKLKNNYNISYNIISAYFINPGEFYIEYELI